MEAILRISLPRSGGKRIPGTVLGAYPTSEQEKFGSGDISGFLLLKVKTEKHDLDELRNWRLKKAIAVDKFMSENSMKKLVEQNAKVVEEIKGGKKVILANEVEIQPRWDKVIDLDESGMVIDTPSDQWPKEIILEDL